MSLTTVVNRYFLPFMVSTAISCATNNNNNNPEYNVIPEPVLLEKKEKELGDAFLDLAWTVKKLGECVEYEANRIDVCIPHEQMTIGDNRLYIRRVKYYDINKDNKYDSVDILLSHPSYPAYTLNENSIRKIRDWEITCHLDVKTQRFLYKKVTKKITNFDLPQKQETTIDVLCFNALDQIIPARDGECLYSSE